MLKWNRIGHRKGTEERLRQIRPKVLIMINHGARLPWV